MSSSTFLELSFLACSRNFLSAHSNPSFLSLDSIACGQAIHSVTHPDLAPPDEPRLTHDSAHPAAAGPENVQCRIVFIHILRTLALQSHGDRVQPSLDSRHGRTA